MTIRKVVSDEVLGHLARRQNELFRRIREGTVPDQWAIDRLQEIIEGPATAIIPSDIEVEVGVYRSAKALLEALRKAEHYVGGGAQALMETPEFRESLSRRKKGFHILFRRSRDFHIKVEIPRQHFFELAIRNGVQLCSPEMGPLIRLGYKHKSEREDVYIGMEPLREINGNEPLIFHVTNNTGQGSKLNVVHGSMDIPVNADELWAFSCPV